MVAQQLPNRPIAQVEIGLREMVENHPWDADADRYPDPEALRKFIATQKERSDEEEPAIAAPDVVYSNEQEQIFALVNSQMNSVLDPLLPSPKKTIVQGKARGGKIHLESSRSFRCRVFHWKGFFRPFAEAWQGSTRQWGTKVPRNTA